MRIQEIQFPKNQVKCVFPESIDSLELAITELGLKENRPVIVLIGGYIQEQHLVATKNAIDTVAKIAEEKQALVISGGTDLGIMALAGQVREEKQYGFPLVGVTVENLVTWPEGPRSRKFLIWGKKRWPLAQYYSHFILVPGNDYGDESPWIIEIAARLSRENQSITILANGGGISRKDIELSLEHGRLVVALAGTGRLADELSNQEDKPEGVIIVPTDDEKTIRDIAQNYL